MCSATAAVQIGRNGRVFTRDLPVPGCLRTAKSALMTELHSEKSDGPEGNCTLSAEMKAERLIAEELRRLGWSNLF